jgi:hypothetical protein
MRRLVVSFGVVALLVVAAPAPASRAVTPTATMHVAVPNQGDVTVIEAVFKIQGGRITKALHPRLRVQNGKQLGSSVVVVASVTQEAKVRSRLDVTAAVILRGARRASALGATVGTIPDALLVLDEPDLRSAKPPPSLIPVRTVATTNVVQGNFVPKYPADCGFGAASFLSGDRSGLPSPQLTLAFSCGLALDQVWMPVSFPSEIGADWCDGLIGTPTAGSTTYPAGFGCNFPINAFAVQDPGKSVGVTGLQLFPPLAGSCKAPFQQPYIGLCTLTSPLAANTPGPFTMTLASALPFGSEFGYTALSGSVQRSFPMRGIDPKEAVATLTDLINTHPRYVRARTEIVQARTAVTRGDLVTACNLLHREFAIASLVHNLAVRDAISAALVLLDCNPRG